jgi:hypothetical protein
MSCQVKTSVQCQLQDKKKPIFFNCFIANRLSHCKPILSAAIEIRVLKQISAIYVFKVGIPALGMRKMKCQNKTNFNVSCFRGIY